MKVSVLNKSTRRKEEGGGARGGRKNWREKKTGCVTSSNCSFVTSIVAVILGKRTSCGVSKKSWK